MDEDDEKVELFNIYSPKHIILTPKNTIEKEDQKLIVIIF